MKERIESLIDSFTDFEGKEHKFVMVAVSQELPTSCDDGSTKIWYDVEKYVEGYGVDETVANVVKTLSIGIAICNPEDNFNEKFGYLKALNRARGNEPKIFSTTKGIINTKMVKAILEQEAEYLKNNPATFITGYKQKQKAYEYDKQMQEVEANLTKAERTVVNEIKENPGILTKIKELLKWKGC